MKQYRLFFSWQNDRKEAKSVVFSALRKAAKKLDAEGMKLFIDQDTRERVGKRNIATEVLDKINRCDIFVADLTPVITYYPPQETHSLPKHMPNSNVMYEYGYALHAKGENRMIALASINKEDDEHIEYMPFDINHDTIALFTDENSLSGLSGWIKKIIEDVDKERAAYVPQYACSLFFQSSEELTNEITINPQYKRILYVRKNDAKQLKETTLSLNWLDSLFPMRNSHQLLFGNQLNFSPKKTINCSLVPLYFIFKNQGTEAFDNLKIQIVANHDHITFTDTNRTDTFMSLKTGIPNSLTISNNSITQVYPTINPDDTLALRPIYIHIPHNLGKLELHWKLTSRRYKEEGILHINVAPQYFVEIKEDNMLANTEKVEDYIKVE